ncbi:MAG TPA: hypothetical protein VH761_08815 [Ilumatobacteraceae bacterium]
MHPWIHWMLVGCAAIGVGVGSWRAIAGVDAARRAWGEQRTVWIATTAAAPGDSIAADRREMPRAMVPATAATDDPSGRVARQHLGAGEIVTVADVGATGQASLVPSGWVALAVPSTPEHFAVGDHVRVFGGDQPLGDGMIVGLGEADLMVAISEQAAPALAAALLADSVTVALSP